MSEIHPTAIVHDGAILGPECVVGPYSIIGPNVILGARNRLASHVVIEGHTTIGDQNQFFQFASVGSAPQDLKYRGEKSTLTMGTGNIVREYVTLQPGTAGGGMTTTIGDRNLFMANSHIGHDGKVGNGNIFANSAAVAGHVTVGNYVVVGGLCGMHQFVRLGDNCLLGAGSMVAKDIPPFCMAQGDRAHLVGLNIVGLERRGLTADDISRIKKLYRQLFLGKGRLEERLVTARETVAGFQLGEQLVEFVAQSERGVSLPQKRRTVLDRAD